MTLFAPQKQAENEVMYQKRRRAAIYVREQIKRHKFLIEFQVFPNLLFTITEYVSVFLATKLKVLSTFQESLSCLI